MPHTQWEEWLTLVSKLSQEGKASTSKFFSSTPLRIICYLEHSSLVQHWLAINMVKNLNLYFLPWSTLHRVTLIRNKSVLTVQCHCPCDFSGAHIPWVPFLCPTWGPYHILQHPQSPRVPTGPQHELLREGSSSLREPSRSSIIKLIHATQFIF